MNSIEAAPLHGDADPTPAPVAPGQPPTGLLQPDTEVTWAAVSHLTWVAGSLVGLPILGPLVAWLALRHRGPFVRHHATEALNANISYLLYTIALTVATGLFTLVTWGLGFGSLVVPAIVPVVGAVFSIVAAASAGQGQWYRYPLVIRFVR